MIETFRKEWQAKYGLVLLLLLTVWWFQSPYYNHEGASRFFGDFPSIYGVMALWGSIWGIRVAQQWGGYKSVMGKAIMFFSYGLLAQVFGQLAYAYLAFYEHIEVPYPSIGDLGYFGSIPLYAAGVYMIAKASGVKMKLNLFYHQIVAVIIPAALLTVGYILFLKEYSFDWSQPIKIFLDFGYPFGQAIYISMAIITYLLSQGILGGLMKNKVLFILFALLVQFLSDYTFLYQSSRGTWAVGGINDFMYLISYFLMTIALIQLQTVLSHFRGEKKG